jgi:hypothetical protein
VPSHGAADENDGQHADQQRRTRRHGRTTGLVQQRNEDRGDGGEIEIQRAGCRVDRDAGERFAQAGECAGEQPGVIRGQQGRRQAGRGVRLARASDEDALIRDHAGIPSPDDPVAGSGQDAEDCDHGGEHEEGHHAPDEVMQGVLPSSPRIEDNPDAHDDPEHRQEHPQLKPVRFGQKQAKREQ